MVLSSVLLRRSAVAAARTRAGPALRQQQQKRHMGLGGSSGPPPEWKGIDKTVRDVFPEDYQRAYHILLLICDFHC